VQEPTGKILKEAAQAKEVNAQGGVLDMKIYPWVGGNLELTNLLSGESTHARLVGPNCICFHSLFTSIQLSTIDPG
jgi:hypothetical protein